MVKEIVIKTNVTMKDKDRGIEYNVKEGVICIEMENGDKYLLDLETRLDLSKCDYISIADNKKTKTKVLFKNIELDNFFLDNVLSGNTSVKEYYKKY
nr:MAG TPA: hypothetical protein [Caudoviricetes sp.]